MRQRETTYVSNKRLAVQSYWAYATNMGAMELHERQQVQIPDNPPQAPTVRKDLHSAKGHDMSFEGAEKIMRTRTWPSYSPQSAQSVYATVALLRVVHKSGAWEDIGKCWLSILFRHGTIIKHKKEKDKYFLVVGDIGHVMVLGWQVQRKPVGRSNVGS